MRRLFSDRVVLIVVALLTLGAYGERAFARFLACDCLCCPAGVAVAVENGKIAADTGNTVSVQLSADENGKAVEDHQDADDKGCSCLCHAATFANVQVAAPALAPLRPSAVTLHAGPPQRPCEGVRAGIEYPPRAA